MVRRDLIVIGGSAGAHAALRTVLAGLPADLPAAVLVVTHLSPAHRSILAEVLAKESALPVAPAADGLPARPGHVYVAVPNRHLLIGPDDVLRLSSGPRENRTRPAVNALFRSAARWAGPRVTGVVLSGTLDDGAAGLAAITTRGGAALVQDPGDARFSGMPRAAIAAVPSAVVAPAVRLAELLGERAGERVRVAGTPDDALIWETDMIGEGHTDVHDPGRPVALGCPECGGGMREIHTGRAVHYVCHVGHSWSPQAFVAASDDGIEEALWTAVSSMQEKVAVLGEMAERAPDEEIRREHRAEADRVRRAIDLLREHLMRDPGRLAGPAT